MGKKGGWGGRNDLPSGLDVFSLNDLFKKAISDTHNQERVRKIYDRMYLTFNKMDETHRKDLEPKFQEIRSVIQRVVH